MSKKNKEKNNDLVLNEDEVIKNQGTSTADKEKESEHLFLDENLINKSDKTATIGYKLLSEKLREEIIKEVIKNQKNINEETKKIIKIETLEAIKKYSAEEDFKKDVKKVAKETIRETEDKLRDKIDDSKLKTIETLGIFVALFTFVSVNINIFNKTKDLYSASAFMILMAIVIMLFTIPILMIFRDRSFRNSKFLLSVFAISIILLITTLIVSKYLNIPLNVNS